ncbi:MAG TPA: hypothetical protein VN824_00625, partial [Puia sp.]|nr:hypothetical protein [Puia sp.]
PFFNPWTSLRQTYHSHLYNVLFDGVATYKVSPALTVTNNIGWNSLTSNEFGQFPISAQTPSPANAGASYFSHTRYTSFILEPQAEFKKNLGLLHMALLAGYSFQNQTADMNALSAFGIATDAQLMHPSSAANLFPANDSMDYNYQAQFARFNFNWDDRYILNLTFRRDASSRINSISQYEGFYAAGAAWVFSYERWIKENLPVLSFGKLRASYGTTGNDQIGGGHTLSSWAPNALINYVNKPGWAMRSLVAPGLNWEKIAKAEGGLELGFLNDRFLLSAVWYCNRTSNQILPDKDNIWRNFPVVLENKGWDLMLSAQLIHTKNISWNFSCNLSLPKDRLVSFPNLEQSNYKDMLIVGRSVNSSSSMYKYLGVDAKTGRYMFFDKNGDGNFDSSDYSVIGGPVVKAFGGFSSSFRYRNIQIEMLFDVRIATG